MVRDDLSVSSPPAEIQRLPYDGGTRYILPRTPGDPKALPRLLGWLLAYLLLLGLACWCAHRAWTDGDYIGLAITLFIVFTSSFQVLPRLFLQFTGGITTIDLTRRRLRWRFGFAGIHMRTSARLTQLRRLELMLPRTDESQQVQDVQALPTTIIVRAWRTRPFVLAWGATASMQWLARDITEQINALRGCHMEGIALEQWVGEVPEDTQQPPTSDAIYDPRDDGATIIWRQPRRRGTMVTFVAVGGACGLVGVGMLALGFAVGKESLSPLLFGLAFMALGAVLTGYGYLRGLAPRYLIDVDATGVTFRRMMFSREQEFSSDMVRWVDVSEEQGRNNDMLLVVLTTGRVIRPLPPGDGEEMHWIAAVLRHAMNLRVEDLWNDQA